MNAENNNEECPEKSYWKSVSEWVKATQNRYSGYNRGDLTQCFMRGPFAGWSERQVAELADLLSQNATRHPLRGHEELDWGKTTTPTPTAKVEDVEPRATLSQFARETEVNTPTNPSTDAAPSDDNENEPSNDDYCPVCRSCGEEGCCTLENSILRHGCKYAEHYAQQAYYDKMVIDEFHKLAEGLGLVRDETGSAPKDPVGDLYDRAWKRVEEKYGKA